MHRVPPGVDCGEARAGSAVDGQALRIPIDDPVLADPGALVECQLAHGVVVPTRRRDDLHHQVGGSDNPARLYDRRALRQHHDEVRLDDIVLRQLHVYRREQDLALAGAFEDGGKHVDQAPGTSLVVHRGRWTHVVSPINDLMPLSVIGKLRVLLVRQPTRAGNDRHIVKNTPHTRKPSGKALRVLDAQRPVGVASGPSGPCPSPRTERVRALGRVRGSARPRP